MGVVKVMATVLLLAVLLHSGCQVTSSRDSSRHRTRASSLSQSVTSFGASLYRQLTSGNFDNLIFSPFSVFVAFTMTLLGAAGTTKREIMTVLSVGGQQGVHQTLHNAIASFPTSDPNTNLTLRVANAAYYNQSRITVLPGFSRNILRYYGGALKPFEQSNPEAAINSWVEEVTDGMIQNFLPPGHFINSDTVLMLLNAVFFQGFWENEFSANRTSESDFTTATGTVVQVPMMQRPEGSINVKNIQALNAQVIELPYKGNRFSLFVIMPNTWDGLMNLERRLDGQMLNRVLNEMPSTISAELLLPKFRLSTGKELNDHLKSMGLRTAFSDRADFRRIATGPLYISKVIHKAIIEVTETGSRAAAVTSVILLAAAIPPITVHVNKPFVFILRDKTSGLNLFMGRVTDPSQE
ncbi:serine protease inhibitor 2.1-like isoform X1 [Pomacea canaliculata]|uniref:serine protease inhibitor 2.1-like isoform X1 n=1 Tax=Pomacea canaliculata TaxID=400727 RepID=UPI000D734AC8|nr:serine protease inhibitor 2.1-like isoform X1 [Pomacea canaliculata]